VLAALLAAALATQPLTPTSACAQLPLVGPVQAPIRVQWFFDPVIGGNLDMWFAIRRLTGELDGEVSFAPIIVANPTHRTPSEEKVRTWFAAAACTGRSEAALRRISREGTARLSRQLSQDKGRRALAKLAGVTAKELDDRRLVTMIERGTSDLRGRIRGSSGRAGRAPAFATADVDTFEDGTRLEAVRRAIEQQRRVSAPRRDVARVPARKGVSQRLIRPPADAGMLLGGVALPHRLVMFAEQEDHPDFIPLGAVLEIRRKLPGWVALQVIARGQSRAAEELRQRLCAATQLGVELDYLRVLTRTAEPKSAEELRKTLDETAAQTPCSDAESTLEALSEGALALPSGIWLDGAALGQREMANLEREILQIEATIRPLDAVFSAAAPSEP